MLSGFTGLGLSMLSAVHRIGIGCIKWGTTRLTRSVPGNRYSAEERAPTLLYQQHISYNVPILVYPAHHCKQGAP